jgi:hypothetical protein
MFACFEVDPEPGSTVPFSLLHDTIVRAPKTAADKNSFVFIVDGFKSERIEFAMGRAQNHNALTGGDSPVFLNLNLNL